MLLNLIIAGIVGCLLLALYVMKGLFDIIKNMDKRINLLHDRLLHVERLMNDRVEAKKNTTKDE